MEFDPSLESGLTGAFWVKSTSKIVIPICLKYVNYCFSYSTIIFLCQAPYGTYDRGGIKELNKKINYHNILVLYILFFTTSNRTPTHSFSKSDGVVGAREVRRKFISSLSKLRKLLSFLYKTSM